MPFIDLLFANVDKLCADFNTNSARLVYWRLIDFETNHNVNMWTLPNRDWMLTLIKTVDDLSFKILLIH
jgi:hypothetical protein